jgi:hypothetical protein
MTSAVGDDILDGAARRRETLARREEVSRSDTERVNGVAAGIGYGVESCKNGGLKWSYTGFFEDKKGCFRRRCKARAKRPCVPTLGSTPFHSE